MNKVVTLPYFLDAVVFMELSKRNISKKRLVLDSRRSDYRWLGVTAICDCTVLYMFALIVDIYKIAIFWFLLLFVFSNCVSTSG